MALGSIVVLAVAGFYLSAVRFSAEGTAEAGLQRQGQLVLDEIARQLRPASSVTTNATCNGTTRALRVARPKVGTDPVSYPDPATRSASARMVPSSSRKPTRRWRLSEPTHPAQRHRPEHHVFFCLPHWHRAGSQHLRCGSRPSHRVSG